MDDLKTRLEALRDGKAQQRRAVWDEINSKAPDLADLLNEIKARFGRPEEVRITIGGKQTWPVK